MITVGQNDEKDEEAYVKVMAAWKNEVLQPLATSLLSRSKARQRVCVGQHARLSPNHQAIALDRPEVRQNRILRQVTGR